MRKGLILLGVAVSAIVVSLFVGAAIAFADNDVHTGTGLADTVDTCASCHRVHTGAGENLMDTAGSQYEFCSSCHNGVGSELDVTDGVTVTGTSPLLAGGFENAKMDVNMDGTAVAAAVTSRHSVALSGSETTAVTWGEGASGQSGASMTLTCGSCHNPHGNGQYRLLRPQPVGGENTNGSVTIADPGVEVLADYVQTYTTTGPDWAGTAAQVTYRDNNADFANVSDWCTQCHTRYLQASAPADTSDADYKYRHRSKGGIDCSDCHVAHGSTSSMGTYSDAVSYPGGSADGANSQSGRLLWADNRGVCIQCHATGTSVPIN